MFERIGDLATALDLTGAVWLPLWAAAVLVVVVGSVGVLAFMRAGFDGAVAVVGSALVLVAILIGWGALDQLARGSLAAERHALDARASDLAARALAPGSALSCLDAIAGEVVEDACEKVLFASPEATAAAVGYVAAQLALLGSAGGQARKDGNSGVAHVRRAVETDRFGIVAHVLALRDGCVPDRCDAFAWLRDTARVKTNLAERPFEARVTSYSASWPAAAARPVARNNAPAAAASLPSAATASNPPAVPTPPAPGTAARVPNNLYFPSASSIPPVNIMTAEPSAPQRPHDTTGATEGPAPAARKPSAGAPQPRQPTNSANAPARPALPLTPAQ